MWWEVRCNSNYNNACKIYCCVTQKRQKHSQKKCSSIRSEKQSSDCVCVSNLALIETEPKTLRCWMHPRWPKVAHSESALTEWEKGAGVKSVWTGAVLKNRDFSCIIGLTVWLPACQQFFCTYPHNSSFTCSTASAIKAGVNLLI